MFKVIQCLIIFLTATQANAETSVNIGWHNPPGSEYGLNLLFAGKNLALELGVGQARGETYDTDKTKNEDNQKSDQEDTAAFVTLGDIDLKYLFSSGGARPYIQGGFGLALAGHAGKTGGASASTGEPFFGAGIFFSGASLNGYLAVIANNQENLTPQAGIGVKL